MSEIINEDEVLSVLCPTCSQARGKGCLDDKRHILATQVGQLGLSFHETRIRAAQETKSRKIFGRLGPTEKALITYYAFIALCNSCAANSERLFQKKYTTEQLQVFFIENAITELKADGLITDNFAIKNVKPC